MQEKKDKATLKKILKTKKKRGTLAAASNNEHVDVTGFGVFLMVLPRLITPIYDFN